MRTAIKLKDFSSLALISMKESNNLHAICLDSFPSIKYLNDCSFHIIKLVNFINESIYNNNITCGYTFDAGPNAFLLIEEENISNILGLFKYVFNTNNNDSFIMDNLNSNQKGKLDDFRETATANNYTIENCVEFNIGNGPQIL